MAISDKTRKILWTRSGNKCSICKTILVTHKSEPFSTTIIGQECHIVSEALNGPRHKNNFDNYDIEENLLLLCSNCHKVIDTQTEYYTIEKLLGIKESHENEIRNILEKKEPDNNFKKVNEITILPKIKTGKELLYLIDDTMAFETDYEDTTIEKELNFIAGIMHTLTEYNDCIAFQTELGYKISLIIEFNKLLKEIEENGFTLFGEKKIREVLIGNNIEDKWKVSSLYLMKTDNKNIIDFSTLNKNASS